MTERLPDFLIVGAMKAGTSSLWAELRRHPEIFMPVTKEPGTLVHVDVERPDKRRQYAHFFQAATEQQRCGEASTIYARHPHSPVAAKRAQAVLGEQLRLIYCVRHPLDRAVSHWLHAHRRQQMPGDFGRALESHADLVDVGRYDFQLAPWKARFDASNFHIVSLEALVSDRASVLHRLANFLELTDLDGWQAAAERANVSGVARRPVAGYPGRLIRTVRRAQFYKRVLAPLLPDKVVSIAHRLTTRSAPAEKRLQPGERALSSAWDALVSHGANQFAPFSGNDVFTWALEDSLYFQRAKGRD